MPLPTADKRASFRKLHEGACFVIPNPFDIGTAKGATRTSRTWFIQTEQTAPSA
jgi:2-methylisocitrate lyase-like PEP mutase family enzyme